ncbi:MAG: hypothetical protein D6769_03280 [Methanobacteriota archaeon]|nr:MAG: hypothetical protein D6769_03280 [Euryarchaeota archaeon]
MSIEVGGETQRRGRQQTTKATINQLMAEKVLGNKVPDLTGVRTTGNPTQEAYKLSTQQHNYPNVSTILAIAKLWPQLKEENPKQPGRQRRAFV